MRLFGRRKPIADDDLDEWERHHGDPRSTAGFALYAQALGEEDLNRLHTLWEEANRLVGQRAPADYGEFLAYGYLHGRMDAVRDGLSTAAARARGGTH